MDFSTVITRNIKGIGAVEIRPYLTTAEIDGILDKIQNETTDYAVRKMIMYATVMKMCTNIKEFNEEEVSIETVELYYLNGTFDRITKFIKGFDILLDGFDKLPILDVYKRFEMVIDEFTKQFKDINLDESMKKFETELDKLKEVEAEKEAILNG